MFRLYALLLLIIFCTSCGVKKTTTRQVEKYENGTNKKIVVTTVKQNKNFELNENYLRTKTMIYEYFPNGKLSYRSTTIIDKGTDIPCRESFYKLEQYHDNGHKKYFYKMECDCHLEIKRSYNENGKLLEKSRKKIKRLY